MNAELWASLGIVLATEEDAKKNAQNAKAAKILVSRDKIATLKKRKYDNSGRQQKVLDAENEPKEKNLRFSNKFADETINAIVTSQCCDNNCISQFSKFDVTTIRCEIYEGDEASYLRGLIRNMPTNANGTISYTLCNKSVCLNAFLKLIAMSKDKFYNIKNEAPLINIDERKYKLAIKFLQCKAWFTEWLDINADKMPDGDNELKLHKYIPWRHILHEMNMHFKTIDLDPVAKDTFAKVRKEFNLKKARLSDHFKCKICVDLQEKRKQAKKDKKYELYEQLTKELDEHLEHQYKERGCYVSERIYAKAHPQQVTSIIVDSSSSRCFPSVQQFKKGVWPPIGDLLQLCFTGVLNHGLNEFHLYTSVNGHFSGDPNYIATIIMAHLKYLREKGNLPPRLHIQLDNCGRENKNCFILAFICFIVQQGIVNEIELSFLIVGHTHEGLIL